MGTRYHAGLQHPDALLLAALRAAPRRYRMPPLPLDPEAAMASGTETALACAIEAARLAKEHGAPPAPRVKTLFTWALGELIREALAADGGDPAFQALVLRAHDPQVAEHVRLSAQAVADRRALRTAIDAIAHPGKMRGQAAGALRDGLSQLHGLAAAGPWTALRRSIEQLLAQELGRDAALRAALAGLLAHPALTRLEQGGALLGLEPVQRYRALCEQRGPLAGSQAAAAKGRASARIGGDAEATTVQAFRQIAVWLDPPAPAPGRHRVVRGLRTPRGFPGDRDKAKDEWDAAIVRGADAGPVDIVLLAEVKASPAAATPDFSRMIRGLQRLAHAGGAAPYAFASTDGEVHVSGESLRDLQPHGHSLPPHVIYCCSAPVETQPQMLSAASKAVLAAEPASLAFAHQLARGGSPRDEELTPVWAALTSAPRLRSALHQYQTARAVREAMLHPDDVLAALVDAAPR